MTGRIPAVIETDFVAGVVVNRPGGVASGVDPEHLAAQCVHLPGVDQMQTTTRWRGPTARQAGKIAGLGGVHIGDSLDDGSGDGVISGVLEESGLILMPDGTPVNVEHGG